jgi:hypothetical protein
MHTKNALESLRAQLNDVVSSDDGNLFEGAILRKSQELDEIINLYYRKSLNFITSAKDGYQHSELVHEEVLLSNHPI